MEKGTARETEETILNWLKDAHAMEAQSLKIFQALESRLKHYPRLVERISAYLYDTRTQELALEGCLERRATGPSALKDLGAWLSAVGQTFSGLPLEDEVVKAVLSTYSFLNMKIASYEILIAAATTLRDEQTLAVCQLHQARERDMAAWLLENMAELTNEFLRRSLGGDKDAKR